MENNKNGKGIFYGVIGVATLIVAIIGATFAYFTATAGSNEAVNFTSLDTSFDVSLSVAQFAPDGTANHLLPLADSDLENAMTFKNAGNVFAPCTDMDGDKTCAIFKLIITNNGDEAYTNLTGDISSVKNEFISGHLKYQLFEGVDTDNDEKADTFTSVSKIGLIPATGTSVSTFQNSSDNNIAFTLNRDESKTYYLAVWLTDTGADDQLGDQGKSFVGTVEFGDVFGDAAKVTATFTTGS